MGEMKRSLVSTVGHARGEWASGRSASRQQALRGGEREEGGIQPDLGDLHRSIAKEIATLALALATTTTTTTTKEKPEYENMVKHYIVASVLLGSMLAGHAHAVTAPHAGLRKLQYQGAVGSLQGLELVDNELAEMENSMDSDSSDSASSDSPSSDSAFSGSDSSRSDGNGSDDDDDGDDDGDSEG